MEISASKLSGTGISAPVSDVFYPESVPLDMYGVLKSTGIHLTRFFMEAVCFR